MHQTKYKQEKQPGLGKRYQKCRKEVQKSMLENQQKNIQGTAQENRKEPFEKACKKEQGIVQESAQKVAGNCA